MGGGGGEGGGAGSHPHPRASSATSAFGLAGALVPDSWILSRVWSSGPDAARVRLPQGEGWDVRALAAASEAQHREALQKVSLGLA